MKKLNNILTSVLLIVLGTVIAINPASAEGETIYCHGDNICSTTPPQPTDFGAFAVVDSTGNVVGVIAGDIRDLGSNDKTTTNYSGCSNSCTLILQQQADPNTGNSAGHASGGSNQVNYNAEQNTFTVKQNNVVVQAFIAPEINKTDNLTTVTSLGVAFSESSTVSSNLSQNDGQNQINPELNMATISASEIKTTSTNSSVIVETLVIQQKVTEQEAITIINNSTNRIMQSKINRLIKLLGDWLV